MKSEEEIAEDLAALDASGKFSSPSSGEVKILAGLDPIRKTNVTKTPSASTALPKKPKPKKPPVPKEVKAFLGYLALAFATGGACGYFIKNKGDDFNTRNGVIGLVGTLLLGLVLTVVFDKTKHGQARRTAPAKRPGPKPGSGGGLHHK